MDACRPSVLLVGESEHHEFETAVAWLRHHTCLETVRGIDGAMQRIGGNPAGWQTVVFAQSRPGLFAARDIDRVGRALPLTHFVALLGSLCEGETRSGQPWPGVVRVYWHQWGVRCASELDSALQLTSWQLPRTASEVERTELLLGRSVAQEQGLVAIYTRRASYFDALAIACRLAGYASVWSSACRRPNFQGAVAALWDAETLSDAEFQQLQQITSLLPDVPVIALLGFPRHNHVRAALARGASSVVSCPFLLPDLWTAIRDAASQRTRP